MRIRLPQPEVTWTLCDQAIVSLGSFAVNLLLARSLEPAQYGLFSLILLAILALSVITNSVLFYPMSVRATVAADEDRGEVFGGGLVLLLLGCIPLCVVTALIMLVLGSSELAPLVAIWFVLRQVQELVRRALFAEMRHAAAVPGDALCYLGSAAVLLVIVQWRVLSVEDAIIAMAATSGLAALAQAIQVGLRFGGASQIRRFALDWAVLGGGSLGSNLLSMLRGQVFPWTLAAAGGVAAAANFQAAWNLVQLTNPIVLGLCNVIPQTAARGRAARSNEHAWHVARPLMLVGAIPIFVYYTLLCAIPGIVLAVLYGSESAYTHLGLVVQVMTLSAAVAYPADMVCSYLHGIEAVRLAMRINLGGLVASVLIGVPLTLVFGITGSCLALLAASCVRTALAYQVLNGALAHDRRRYA